MLLKRLVAKTLSILSPDEKRRLYLLTVFSTIISIADILSLAILVIVIGIYTGNEKFSQTGTASESFRNSLLLLFLGLFIIKNIFGYLIQQAQYRFVYNVATRLSNSNLEKYFHGPYSGYLDDSSVHIREIQIQPIEFSQNVLASLQQIFTESLLILLAIIGILLYNATLFLLLLVILLPGLVLIGFLTRNRLKTIRKDIKVTGAKALQHLQESLSGYIEANIFQRVKYFNNKYIQQQQRMNKSLADIQVIQGTAFRLVEIFAIVGLIILVFISIRYRSSSLDIVTLGAFTVAAYKIIPGMVRILNLSGQVRTYAFTLDSLEVSDDAQKAVGSLAVESIELRNASFGFTGKMLFTHTNLIIQKGDFVAISGDSGIGKTTLINLLLGCFEPFTGSILFNGKEVNASGRKQYWGDIAYVKQQGFLFHDTLLANITLDSAHETAKLENSIRQSGLTDFINSLPRGLDELISENGKNISGGQRQRIALARAFYKDAGVIILDEPFNELDSESERSLLSELKNQAAKGKIIIMITHNELALDYCSKSLVLHEN